MSLADVIAAKKADPVLTPVTPVTPESNTTETSPTPETVAALTGLANPMPSTQTFAATDMFRFVLPDGSWKESVDGVFTPSTQEEYEMLLHYASVGKVEEIKGE